MPTVPIVLILVVWVLAACTNDNQPPPLEVDVTKASAKPPVTPSEELRALNKVTGPKGKMHDSVADIRAILHAQALSRQEKHAEATSAWRQALSLAQDGFGKIALEGWIASYTNHLGKKSDRKVLARLFIAETNNGASSPYMAAKNITTEDAILPFLEAKAGKWLTEKDYVANPDFDAPLKKGIPSGDPLLEQAAADFCRADQDQRQSWDKWAESLGLDTHKYWSGLISQCQGDAQSAQEAYQKSLTQLGASSSTRHLAINAAGKLAVLQRRNAMRIDAADTYRTLMEIWAKGKVGTTAFGDDKSLYHIRKVNDALWAARYRALIGDHENAKAYAQAGLDAIGVALGEQVLNPSKFRAELTELKAEAYHILAYRIAVEQGAFETAKSLSLLALQTPDLPEAWIDRLTWFTGFYDYLSGNYASAKNRWQQMESETKDETLRPMLYFWLAKAHDRMNQKAESENFLDALADDYPLSYYSVVAPQKSGLRSERDWRSAFGNVADLAAELREGRDYNLGHIRKDEELGPRLLRAEILTAAGLQSWAHLAIGEFAGDFKKRFILENHAPEYLYLTRLYYNAGQYLQAIALTTQLMRNVPQFWKSYPEQLLIYFPKPFQDTYAREALDQRMEEELLLAISRQESGFSARIKSHAGAVGVMQLILPTARRFASEMKIPPGDIRQQLQDPSINIKLGTRFLHTLTSHYDGYKPAVYGGYNAGEYAMNAWLKRRAHSDPTVFIELVPFGETKGYIKNVWRNLWIYHYLRGSQRVSQIPFPHPLLGMQGKAGPETL